MKVIYILNRRKKAEETPVPNALDFESDSEPERNDPNAIEIENPKKKSKLKKRIKKNRMFQRRNIMREKKRQRRLRHAPVMVVSRKHLNRLKIEK
jgi:hypothetical protein